MILQKLLNDIQKFPGFRYGKIEYNREAKEIRVRIHPDKRYKAKCGECQKLSPGYDTLRERTFLFVPLWGLTVKFLYAPRRVNCPEHGIGVEYMPWALGKSPVTKPFGIFLAYWAKKLDWKDVSTTFHVSWDAVYSAVQYVVDYGLKNRVLDGINQLGLDEIHFKKMKYVTMIYDITEGQKRLLWLGLERKAKTLLRGFRKIGLHNLQGVVAVSMDMWQAYVKVVEKKLPTALIILDRFHIMKKFNEAIDKVRRQEFVALKADGHGEVLHNSRWCFLKRRKNLSERQEQRLQDLMKQNLKTYKSYLLRESFQKFWLYKTARWAKKFLKDWTFTAMRSRIEPMKKVAEMLRSHQYHISNWFKISPRVSNGVVEGFNNKAKTIIRQHYGFRTFSVLELALYHTMGDLPMPKLAHSFV
jgi:transposase